MNHRFGVHKLVLLNSGGFRFAEFDLTRPVHFAADNNGGKSTLVNALQFLLVDEFEKMVFGDHDLASTRHHYFGQNPSYIVFECLTRSGPQCLVVAGQGDIGESRFDRFVYRGPFDISHYQDDDGRLADQQTLHRKLVTADVLEVKHSRLWRVLCRPNDVRGNDLEASRLGILPIKRVEDYHSFREVFIKLLSLSKAQADELKRLLIACSCQTIRATSIDVRKRYNEEFSRLERDDKELEWIKAVLPQIERGLSLRLQAAALDRQLADAAVAARVEWRRSLRLEQALTVVTQERGRRLADARKGCDEKLNALRETVGALKRDVGDASLKLEKLDEDHRTWGATSDLVLSSWRNQAEDLQTRYHDIELKLRETQRADVPTLERRCMQKRQEIERLTRELQDWDTRTAGYLDAMGFTPSDLNVLFTFVNPALARVSHRDLLGDSDPNAVKALIARTLESTAGNTLELMGVTVNLGATARTDVVSMSRESVAAILSDATEELHRQETLLAVALDADRARQKQKEVHEELRELTKRLQAYDAYREQYAKRAEVVASLQRFQEQLASTQEGIGQLLQQEQSLAADMEQLQEIGRELKRADGIRTSLSRQLGQIQIGEVAPLEEDVSPSPEEEFSDLASRLSGVMREMARFTEQLEEFQQKKAQAVQQLEEVQKHIAAAARKGGGRTAVFDQDVEQDWRDLEAQKNALGENERRLHTLWDALFKSLAAELALLKQSVAEVKKRATRINADLKQYKVSNLESVEVHIDHDTHEYAVIEKLTAESSIFLVDSDPTEAKRELQKWITDGRTIELRDIFTVRIRIHNQGESRPVDVPSLDEIGSQGTGMTAKVMIYLQLLRSIVDDARNEIQMHFYLDEIGKLDDRNLHATTEMAVRRGFVPITAEPEPRAESLAHPEVTIYHLGKSGKHFEIVHKLTYGAKAKARPERAVAQ